MILLHCIFMSWQLNKLLLTMRISNFSWMSKLLSCSTFKSFASLIYDDFKKINVDKNISLSYHFIPWVWNIFQVKKCQWLILSRNFVHHPCKPILIFLSINIIRLHLIKIFRKWIFLPFSMFLTSKFWSH